ncbi:MAG: serine hydrolase domain-containing protein, partial [Anaerolineales bacterium]
MRARDLSRGRGGDGTIAYARGYGMANLELGIAISPRTIFDLGSTSKQFTAFTVLMLAAEGRLRLDDPVRTWLPELGSWAQPITVRHLVHHTSGLRDYLTLMSLAGVRFEDVTDDEDALRLIARQQAPNFPA